MKFIHVADLHLGKKLKEFSFLDDQKVVLGQIVEAVKKHKPEAVFIAGDVYDRSVPSEEAVVMFDEFLCSLARLDTEVFIISGNHDSAERMGFGSALMDMSGVHISPVYNGTLTKHTVKDEYGEVDVYMLPFVRPAAVRAFFEDEEIVTYTDAVRVALSAADIDFENRRNVLLSHQFVTGGSVCESEMLVGGLENVDGSVYDGFDYVALGHLHRSQSVGTQRISYSGTPLKYSLSEEKHIKKMTVGTLGKDGELTLEYEEYKPIRDLRIITDTFENAVNAPSDDYVHISLTDKERIPQAGDKLKVSFPNMLSWNYESLEKQHDSHMPMLKSHEGRDPEEVFAELFLTVNGKTMSSEQAAIVTSLVRDIWRDSQ